MKIAIFEDGKTFRGSKATLIKRGNKRVLIEFIKYDYDTKEYVLVTEWFTLFIPSYVADKKRIKHNNKRKNASYCHCESNEFYSDECQTESYKAEFKEYVTADYYEVLYGDSK